MWVQEVDIDDCVSLQLAARCRSGDNGYGTARGMKRQRGGLGLSRYTFDTSLEYLLGRRRIRAAGANLVEAGGWELLSGGLSSSYLIFEFRTYPASCSM